MPVKYIIVPHKIPSKPDQPPIYYPRLKSIGEINLREIAEDIAKGSTVSPGDTMAVIESLLQKVPDYLARGYIVRLGELGSFYLSIQAEGSDSPEKVNASKIKRNKLHFRAGKVVKQMLKHLDYRKA
jgi:predicted histone-like DNA-binding protein